MPEAGFRSILFAGPDDPGGVNPDEQRTFVDLNLGPVVAAITAGRAGYGLESLFSSPLRDASAVQYRQEVLRDLERPEVAGPILRFAVTMEGMRKALAVSERAKPALRRQAYFVDAIEIYVRAVDSLVDGLDSCAPRSGGMRGLLTYLGSYVASAPFRSLAVDTQALRRALAEIRYRVHIEATRVTVSRYDGEPDYSLRVEETFAKFQQGATHGYVGGLSDGMEISDVDNEIFNRVVRLHPEVFEQRTRYCARHRDYLDPTVARFDREAQFCLAYLELIGPLRAAGLPFCYPEVSAESKEVSAVGAFDLALAATSAVSGGPTVGNDFHLSGRERVLVISGPNSGGKTTLARTFGQLHHLARLGLPVPGSEARLFLADRIYTHFAREESIETGRSLFEDELVRVHAILARATPNSIIVLNESFNSTSVHDAMSVGTKVMGKIAQLDCLAVYVTFVDEIAALSDATVSMVAQIAPEDPSQRTFKVLRQPADGLAYAWAIAEKHGLTYKRLIERISG